jgi:hypothetical protein
MVGLSVLGRKGKRVCIRTFTNIMEFAIGGMYKRKVKN